MTNLPNALTLLRILLVPILIILLLTRPIHMNIAAAGVFALASMTDMLDGYLARLHNAVTRTGKLFDPLADKLLISTALIMLIPLERVQAWVVALIVGREMAVTGLRGMASSEGIVVQASLSGKYKAIFQGVSAFCLIVHDEYLTINFHRVGMVFLWIALAMTLWSGYDYFRKYFSWRLQEGG